MLLTPELTTLTPSEQPGIIHISPGSKISLLLRIDAAMQIASASDASAKMTASVDLQPNEHVFILPISLAASMPDLEQRIREDKDFRTFCAEPIQLPSGDTALDMQCSTRLSHALGHSRAQPCLNRKSVQGFGDHDGSFCNAASVLLACNLHQSSWTDTLTHDAMCTAAGGREQLYTLLCMAFTNIPPQDNFNALIMGTGHHVHCLQRISHHTCWALEVLGYPVHVVQHNCA